MNETHARLYVRVRTAVTRNTERLRFIGDTNILTQLSSSNQIDRKLFNNYNQRAANCASSTENADKQHVKLSHANK